MTAGSSATVPNVNIPKRRNSRFIHHLGQVSDVMDRALAAFVETRKILEENQDIQLLCKDPRLQQKLPGYVVRMGYGCILVGPSKEQSEANIRLMLRTFPSCEHVSQVRIYKQAIWRSASYVGCVR